MVGNHDYRSVSYIIKHSRNTLVIVHVIIPLYSLCMRDHLVLSICHKSAEGALRGRVNSIVYFASLNIV